jgi:hypothetical protein
MMDVGAHLARCLRASVDAMGSNGDGFGVGEDDLEILSMNPHVGSRQLIDAGAVEMDQPVDRLDKFEDQPAGVREGRLRAAPEPIFVSDPRLPGSHPATLDALRYSIEDTSQARGPAQPAPDEKVKARRLIGAVLADCGGQLSVLRRRRHASTTS